MNVRTVNVVNEGRRTIGYQAIREDGAIFEDLHTQPADEEVPFFVWRGALERIVERLKG